MKHILTYLAVAVFTLSASAAEKIEGAFGFKLGEVLDFADARLVKEDGPKSVPELFVFKPANPNPVFAHYYIEVTPNSHRIYKITAVATSPAPEQDTSEWNQFDTICALLHRKYGLNTYRYPINLEIAQNYRIIRSKTDKHDPKQWVFELSYTDQAIATEGSEESLDNRLKGADATGL